MHFLATLTTSDYAIVSTIIVILLGVMLVKTCVEGMKMLDAAEEVFSAADTLIESLNNEIAGLREDLEDEVRRVKRLLKTIEAGRAVQPDRSDGTT